MRRSTSRRPARWRFGGWSPPETALPPRAIHGTASDAPTWNGCARSVRHSRRWTTPTAAARPCPWPSPTCSVEVRPLLDGRYNDGTGTALFGVTAELMLDVGWMAYDNADHRRAAGFMGQALRLSHAADDRLFGGRVLAAMSHQALHLGQIRLSVDLVNAARVGTERIVTPRARAMFAAMEAMAQAADRDPRRFTVALGTAESALAQAGSSEDDPDWLDFDEGGLWGHAARAYRYLNNGEECKRHAQRAIALCLDEHGRTRAQRQSILAAGQLRRGDVEQAAATGMRVVATAWGLTSRHVDQEIVVLARAVQRTRSKSTTCTGFLDQAREYFAARNLP